MSVTPTKENLVALDEVKEYLQITDTAMDSRLMSLITGVSRFVENFCERFFTPQTITSEMPDVEGTEVSKIFLRYYPVISLTSVTEYGTALTEGTDFELDYDTGAMEKIGDSIWSETKGLAKQYRATVSYTAGFKSIPRDLKMAVSEMVGIVSNLKTITYTVEGVPASLTITEFPDWVQKILFSYRQVNL